MNMLYISLIYKYKDIIKIIRAHKIKYVFVTI